MVAPDLSIYFRLSELRPTEERLRRLVSAFARWGYTGVFLDWCDAFPWTVDERFCGPMVYREELVAGIYREARENGIELITHFPALDNLGFITRIEAYSRLFRWEGPRPVLDVTIRAARKFLADLVEDFTNLVPQNSGVFVDCRARGTHSHDTDSLVGLFRAEGIPVFGRVVGADSASEMDMEGNLRGFDGVVVPISSDSFRKTAEERVGDTKLVYEVDIAGTDGGYALSPSEREERDQPGLTADLPRPALISFQRGGWAASSGELGAAESVLRESAELALKEIRSAGAKLGRGATQLERTSGMDAPRELDELERPRGIQDVEAVESEIGRSWRMVRSIRERLAADLLCHDGGASSDPSGLLEALDELGEQLSAASDLVQEVRRDLSPFVEKRCLERILGSLIVPLYEEYHSLLPRIAARSRRELRQLGWVSPGDDPGSPG